MKIVFTVLLCLAITTSAMAAKAKAPKKEQIVPEGLIVCQSLDSLNELVLGAKNDDEKQINFLFKDSLCFEVKTGLAMSYAGDVGEDFVKIRLYTEKGSAIVYTHKALLPLEGEDS